jgi:hypothetical protein
MDPDADPDPAIFGIDLQDVKKKLIFLKEFFGLLLFGSKRPKNMWIRIRNTGVHPGPISCQIKERNHTIC